MTHPDMVTGTATYGHPRRTHALPYPENPDGPRWGPAVLYIDTTRPPTAGDPCGYCGQPIAPLHVVTAGVGYCNHDHADLAVNLCGDCGGDIRLPSVGGTLPACDHHGRWVPSLDLPPITFQRLVEPAPAVDKALGGAA